MYTLLVCTTISSVYTLLICVHTAVLNLVDLLVLARVRDEAAGPDRRGSRRGVRTYLSRGFSGTRVLFCGIFSLSENIKLLF